MKTLLMTACLGASTLVTAQANTTGSDPHAPRMIPRMVSPSIDVAGSPFSYPSRPTDQISVMFAPNGTEITPEGYLYTGHGELMFFLGIDRAPLQARIRTLEEGYLPIVHATQQHGGISYELRIFAASLGPSQDGTRVANFVRVIAHNPTETRKRAYITTAWRYQAEQTTPYNSGDNRFERPVKAAKPGEYAQDGEAFHADSVYTAGPSFYARDGKVIYLFPNSPQQPLLRPTLRDFYNLLDLGPVGIKTTAIPQTPVATAQYEVELKPGEEQSFDFVMPLAPIDPAGEEMQLIRSTSFDQKHSEVASFWKATLQRGMQIETPEAKVNDTFRTSLVNDLMSLNKVDGNLIQTINQLHYHGFYLRDSADFVRMYDTSGYPEIGGAITCYFATKQRPDGNFLSQEGQYDGWGETLWTYGEHYRMTRDRAFATEVYPKILRAVEWLEGALAKDPLHVLPATDVRDNEFVPGHLTGYNFLALNGLQSAERIAHDLGHTADEARFRNLEQQLRKSFLLQLEKASAAAGGKIPPSLELGAGGTDWGNLLSVTPEEQLNPFDPKVTATLRDTQSRYQEGLMTYHQDGQGTFLHHYLTIKNTLTELIRGEDEQAIRELYAVLLHTSSTHAGFEYSIRPWGDRDFSGNLAPHGWFAAEYRNLLRNMMVRERGNTLHLLSAASPAWFSKGDTIRVQRAATYFGNVDFTLSVLSEESATFHYKLLTEAATAPAEIVLHLPWFLSDVTASNGRQSIAVTHHALTLAGHEGEVTLHWKKQPLASDMPKNYDDAVQRYKDEYRRRYVELTGDIQPQP